jgi:hypothetical protein
MIFWILLSVLIFFSIFIIITLSISATTLTRPPLVNQTLLDLSNVASISNTYLVAEKFQTPNGFKVADETMNCNILSLAHDIVNTKTTTASTFILTTELKVPSSFVEPQNFQSNHIFLNNTSLDANQIMYTENKNSMLVSNEQVVVSNETSSTNILIGDITITNRFLSSLVFVGTDMKISTTSPNGASLFLPSEGGSQFGSLSFGNNVYSGFTLRIIASGTFTTSGFGSKFRFCIGNTELMVDGLPQQVILGDVNDGLAFNTTEPFGSPWRFVGILTVNSNMNDSIETQSFGQFSMGVGGPAAAEQIYQKTTTIFNGLESSFWGIINPVSETFVPTMILHQLSMEQLW